MPLKQHPTDPDKMVYASRQYDIPQLQGVTTAQPALEWQMNFPFLKAKERLIRIMGTFDLATGHADTFDELLDSLESELRDVLGHYREALAQPAKEILAYCYVQKDSSVDILTFDDEPSDAVEGTLFPLYAAPPQRKWVDLTPQDLNEIFAIARTGEHAVRLALDKSKKKNT